MQLHSPGGSRLRHWGRRDSLCLSPLAMRPAALP